MKLHSSMVTPSAESMPTVFAAFTWLDLLPSNPIPLRVTPEAHAKITELPPADATRLRMDLSEPHPISSVLAAALTEVTRYVRLSQYPVLPAQALRKFCTAVVSSVPSATAKSAMQMRSLSLSCTVRTRAPTPA